MKLIAFPLLALSLSSCCLKRMELTPDVGLEYQGAKAPSVTRVGFGIGFEFKEWCPSGEDKEQLKFYAAESRDNWALWKAGKISTDRYRAVREELKQEALDYLAVAQFKAKAENGKLPETVVSPVATSQTNTQNRPAPVSLTKEGSETSQKEETKKAVEKIEAPLAKN